MSARKPLLIAFSGNDGAGKSTQIELADRFLSERGYRVKRFWSRGGYTPGFVALKSAIRKVSGRRVLPAAGRSKDRQKKLQVPRVRKAWLRMATLDLLVTYALMLRWWRARGGRCCSTATSSTRLSIFD
jgi:hypothetical protein